MKKYLLALLMLCPLLFVQNVSAGIKIYVQATNAPYLYAWDSNYNPLNGEWPGTLMTEQETVNETQFWVKEFDVEKVNIIFNNGQGSQTSDITNLTSDHYFTYDGASTYTDETETYTGEEIVHTWGVVGFGPNPETSDWTNDIQMTDDGEGVWSITITDVVVEEDDLEWEYKVRQDGKWDVFYPGSGEPNRKITFDAAGTYDVYISYNSIFNDLSETITPQNQEPQQENVYTVAGSPEIFGSAWDSEYTSNDMTYNEEKGLYELVKENVTLEYSTEYMFKVVMNHSWENNWGANGYLSDNVVFSVDETAAYDITITFDSSEGIVAYTVVKHEEEQPVNPDVYTVAGTPAEVFGAEWTPGLNVMTENEGVYTWTATDVPLLIGNTYAYKVVKNGEDWIGPEGVNEGPDYVIDVQDNGLYDITFTLTIENGEYTVSHLLSNQRELEIHTMSFINLAGWDHVYAYGFTTVESEGDSQTTEFNGAWPGEECQPWTIDETPVLWKTDSWGDHQMFQVVYYGEAPEFVVFSNGEGAQTINLPFAGQLPYAYEAEDGSTIILMTTNDRLSQETDEVVPEGAKVSLARNFTPGMKCTVVLPFDITAEQAAAAGKFYTPIEVDGDKIRFIEVTDIKAYTPYMFEPAVETPFKGLDIAVIPASAKIDVAIGEDGIFTYETSVTEVDSDTDPDWAYFGWKADDGEFFKAAPGIAYSYRAFLKLRQDVVPQSAKFIAVFGEETGINTIESITEGAAIYNMQGMRVQSPTRGLYIINGKKVVVK